MILGDAGPVLVVDRAQAALLYRAVEAFERDLERVAPSQLRHARSVKADLAAYLVTCSPRGCGTATDQWQPRRASAHDGSGEVPVISDRYTVSQAAVLLSCSESYVRRMASTWGGVLVAGRWLIPARKIDQLKKERHKNGR